MSDFPDPEEEFELMHADELELLREQDYEDEDVIVQCRPKVKTSLTFNTRPITPERPITTVTNETDTILESNYSEIQNSEHNSEPYNQNFISQNIDTAVNSRKRLADDLFGDITDIEDILYENVPSTKRHKAEDKLREDLDLIALIVKRRNENKSKHLSSLPVAKNQLMRDLARDKRNLSLSVPKYPYVKVKLFDGEFVYVRCHSEEYEKEETLRLLESKSFKGIMGDNFNNMWNEANALINKELSIVPETSTKDVEIITANNEEKLLWADLYKPRKYLELLSDESTNRTLLRWLKLWDKVVFNKNPRHMIKSKNESVSKFFKFNELNTKLDELGRPHNKVVLLCGPPGLGKTTLAHMVAKHAGYNVIEINASDDRSTDAFRTTLENATQMQSVVDQQNRPNCIVFDEIDGAPQASIDFLVKFISGVAPVKGKKSKTKEQGQHVLKRPIICICNDGYVPALRPLRQIAFVMHFPSTSTSRLAERLMEISRRQQIKTDNGAMMALAEKSNNDIRSCLSVLHFFKAQNKAIGLTDVHKASVGQKDMQKGLFTVWQDIFQIKRVKNSNGGLSLPTMKDRMQNVLNVISSFGDHDRVAQGVYENFPLLQAKEKDLESTSCGLDWFCLNDLFTKYIYSEQDYSLTAYLNYAFVVWNFVFASTQKPKLNFPSAGYEYRVKKNRHEAVVTELLRGMPPSVRCYQSALPLVLDVLPHLLRIISPSLRPVSLHLYTEEERAHLLKVAAVMADYNLNYIQERTSDGTYEFKLEPNIEDSMLFDKKDTSRISLSYSNRQLIAREVEMEKLRRLEANTLKSGEDSAGDKLHITSKNQQKGIKKNTTAKDTEKSSAVENEKVLPNHLQTIKFKDLKTNSKMNKHTVKRDFFGRIIQTAQSSAKVAGSTSKNDIWFQYKEGFSNAVKKKIKVKDLR
ncbi:chromosome transmission fidelity protein 18 homolog [Euwallacea fornicatus]|uniref:chromosome transmission fidelity protein 18 homolog n=1 Tax=Euwallacea fornicatus TaxID=995702 RepID=UPI00338D378F